MNIAAVTPLAASLATRSTPSRASTTARRALFAVGLLTALGARVDTSLVRGDDWPQWQGPTRDSVWHETGIVERFSAEGPRVLWRVPVAGGYSGPAVAGGRVFVSDYVRTAGEAKNDPGSRPKLQGQERLHCLDATTGKTVWTYTYDCTYEISYPAGPRATPTVDGDRVYLLGAEGNLACLNVADGSVVWRLTYRERFQAPTPIWGFSGHPLVDGPRLYVTPGGPGALVVALDKLTGQEIWRSLSSSDAGYAPPTLITVAGQPQLVVFHPQGVSAVEPATGKPLWTEKIEPNYGMSINAPVQVGDQLFVAAIVNQGLLLKLSSNPPTASVSWRVKPGRGIGPVHSPAVPIGSIVYGVDREGELTGFDVADGKHLWGTYVPTTGDRRANSGTAFLVRNGERFLIFSETGDLILARLTPTGYEELSRAHVLEPTHEAFGRSVLWSHPAFANRTMFARNDKELIAVSLAP